jgi:hypothetical protein
MQYEPREQVQGERVNFTTNLTKNTNFFVWFWAKGPAWFVVNPSG